MSAGESCACGSPMVVARVLAGVVFGRCLHCDGPCMVAKCGRCSAGRKAANP